MRLVSACWFNKFTLDVIAMLTVRISAGYSSVRKSTDYAVFRATSQVPDRLRLRLLRQTLAQGNPVSMTGDVAYIQCNACFPARSPVVRPVPAVNKAVTQVWCAVRSVAQVPLLVNHPRVFIDWEAVFKRPGERCYSSGQYPPDFVTTNLQVPSVIGAMCYSSLVATCNSHSPK